MFTVDIFEYLCLYIKMLLTQLIGPFVLAVNLECTALNRGLLVDI